MHFIFSVLDVMIGLRICLFEAEAVVLFISMDVKFLFSGDFNCGGYLKPCYIISRIPICEI